MYINKQILKISMSGTVDRKNNDKDRKKKTKTTKKTPTETPMETPVETPAETLADKPVETLDDTPHSETSVLRDTKEREKDKPTETSLDDEDDGSEIELLDNEGKAYKVSKKGACLSTVVKNALEKDPTAKQIPTKHITGPVIEKIVAWCNRHAKVPPPKIAEPIPSNDLKECGIDEFDVKLVDDTKLMVFEIILAANYLDIQGLLYLASAKIATYIRDKTPAEIREAFDITEPTPEEEEEIEKQFKDLIG